MTADRPRLCVCICTYRRPAVLARLLEEIAVAAERARSRVALVVVDDDPDGSAGPVLAAAPHVEGGVHTAVTGSGNVSVARNEAVRIGLEHGDRLVFIDDDCRPHPDWLSELERVQEETGADVVAGACDSELPDDAPRWLVDEPFLGERFQERDGADTDDGYVKNLLVTAEALRRTGVRFDPRFGVAGGEDAMFLTALRVAGLRIVHAAGALVSEAVPPERATLRWNLRRRLWYGNTEAVTTIAAGAASRPRVALRGARSIADGLLHPVRRIRSRRSPQFRFALGEVLRGVGRALGATGVWLRHH